MHTQDNTAVSKVETLHREGLTAEVQPIDWCDTGKAGLARQLRTKGSLQELIKKSTRYQNWQWPQRPIYFFADPHADSDALLGSLQLAGLLSAATPRGVSLSDEGKRSLIIIGGDCLDKGPCNLSLLDALLQLKQSGARLIILAGNHDVRLLMGLLSLGKKGNPLTEHFFLRMGPKVVPLLYEVYCRYVAGKTLPFQIPGNKECRQLFEPSKQWSNNFRIAAKTTLNPLAIEKEVKRMEEKLKQFRKSYRKHGMTSGDIYATALVCQQLFLQKGGKYSWFFQDMQLSFREGSFLFVHAGIDDSAIQLLENHGFEHLNALYKTQINGNIFDFYFGNLANIMRTKYRAHSLPLTELGVSRLHRMGVHALVQGHRNRLQGQRLALRQGLLHIECDTTLDRNSRSKEGLSGIGSSVTVIKDKCITGISNDYPFAKILAPEAL